MIDACVQPLTCTADLPQATFDIVVPCLDFGDDGAIVDHLRWEVDLSRPWPRHTRAGDDCVRDREAIKFTRIRRLSTVPDTLPDMYSMEEAFNIMMGEFDMDVQNAGGYIWENPDGFALSIISDYDQRLFDMVVDRVKRSSIRQEVQWSPFNALVDVMDASLFSDPAPGDEHKTFHDPSTKIMVRTLELLRELRSRHLGAMLAAKVAEHLLPPELVEMIGDCFYNKELLTSLKL